MARVNYTRAFFMLLKLTTTCFLFLVLSFYSLAQKSFNPDKKHDTYSLIEDLSILNTSLKKAHPSLFWYTDKLVWNTSIAQKNWEINKGDSLTERELLKHIVSLNSYIKCVHTDIRPSKNYDAWWKKEAKLIPLNIIAKQGKYYVYQNYSDNAALLFGARIYSIEGEPIENIIETILPYIPADGNNETRKYFALRGGFYRYYSYYIKPTSNNYSITYSSYGETEKKKVVVKGISKQTLDFRRSNLKENTAPISFKQIDSLNAALLSVPTFRNDLFKKSNIHFSKYLDSVFSVLREKGTESLVVDLRGNGGGYSEYGAILLTYLADTAFEYCRNQWLTSDSLFPFLEYDIATTFKGFPKGVVKEDGGYKWKKHSVLGWRDAAKNRFKGKAYFLIDGGGASTTSEVASIAKANNMGVFIGEEVGGSYKGDSGGILGWLTLPNTKIRVRIAIVKYELAVEGDNNGNGVQPDFYISNSITDLVTKKDKELNFTLQLIKENK